MEILQDISRHWDSVSFCQHSNVSCSFPTKEKIGWDKPFAEINISSSGQKHVSYVYFELSVLVCVCVI